MGLPTSPYILVFTRSDGGVFVDFPTAIKNCLAKYVDFEGRASRSEYWYFFLFQVIVGLLASIVDGAGAGGVVSVLAWLCLVLPSLAVQVRRLHDIDRSGWWVLIGLIPIVGFVLLIVWCCQRGSSESNRFGDAASVGGEVDGFSSPEVHSMGLKRPADLDGLEKLFELHERGVLTKEEFEAQKAAILR